MAHPLLQHPCMHSMHAIWPGVPLKSGGVGICICEGLVWDLKRETLKYLAADTQTLWEIMDKFSLDIWDECVNITCSTISALAFKIYKTNYLNNTKICQVKGIAHEIMRLAYFGGRTEVYTPKGLGLESFDINSSYPACMKKSMPVGQPVFSNDPDLNNYFGVVYAKIQTINWDDKNTAVNTKFADGGYDLEQSLPISIFITAYGRMLISDAINHVSHVQKKKVFMTDTDCIWMNAPLSPKFIGKELGLFKKEFSATESIFPAPKLYYAINKNGEEVKKGKGIKRGSLNREDYLALAEGKPVCWRE